MAIISDNLREFIPAGDQSITWKECLAPWASRHARAIGRPHAGIGLYGPAEALDSFAVPSANFVAAAPNGYQWIPQAHLKALITVFAGMARRRLIHTHDALSFRAAAAQTVAASRGPRSAP
jgi:hypothetical protein